MNELYSTKRVAEIVGLQESRLRYWAQTGFVGPSTKRGSQSAYSFQDLVSVRAAKELLDRGISLQRARKALEALRVQLPQIERPLAELRIVSDGERVLVVGEGAYEPVTGQLVFDFRVGELIDAPLGTSEMSALGRPTEETETAYDLFEKAMALELAGQAGQDRNAAEQAYERALTLDPQFAAAHNNLGNLQIQRGNLAEARRHYEAALGIDPEQPEARFNLGNVFHDLGEHERAEAAWYRVLGDRPEFADAHFNLGLSLLGRRAPTQARAHLERYLELEGHGDWADKARSLIATLSHL